MDRERAHRNLSATTESSGEDQIGINSLRAGAGSLHAGVASHRSGTVSSLSKTRIFTIIVVLANGIGNFALARGMHGRTTVSALDYLGAIFTPWVIVGILLLILWLLSRMALMSWADLSYVLPVTSIGYAASALIGHFLLNEHVTPARWGGTLLVVAGAVLVGRGAPHSRGSL